MNKPKIHASTQRFTEIEEFLDTVVILRGGFACLIIEIQATNFALLSQNEQLAKIGGYASLLNSLSFPVQILVKNKQEDISSYLKLLENQQQKTKSEELSLYISEYKQFVEQLVKQSTILDKKFYMVLSFSSLELGPSHAFKGKDFNTAAAANLTTKSNSLLEQIGRLNLKAKVLRKDELIRLFYELFNPLETSLDILTTGSDIETPMVKGGK